jgi:hypothetical protein
MYMKQDTFKNPDVIFRPAPFWSWNDSLDKEEMKRQIKEMSKQGWGGYFCHSRIGLVTGYLTDDWMEMINTAAQEAGKIGTYAWLYDEDKWPSGYAGGILAKEEKHRDRCILMLKKADITNCDVVLKEFIYNGQEYVICRHIMPLGDEWFNGTTYVDLMNSDTVRAFLDSTHEKYKEACGKHFGKEIPGVFTDEPCYFMNKYYKDNRFILMKALPWTEEFSEFFEKLKGYSVLERIEELFININDYRKTRFDFFDAATRLFVNNFTKQYSKWCSDNDLKLTGHFMGEDTMMLQIEYIGAAMPHYEYMQWPGVDKLSRNITDLVAIKQLTSVTEQLDKERAVSETFGCMGQQTSFFHRKRIADWQAVLGINFINHHLSLYSMRGERKRDYPPNFFYQQPWWNCEKAFSDYLARLSYTVTQGKRDVDILILHPISSAWCEYTPLDELKDTLSTIKNLDSELSQISKTLAAKKLDFHYGDEIIMENHGRIENGKLAVGKHTYSTIVVPTLINLRKETFNLLKEFADADKENNIVLVSPLPNRLDGELCNIEWPKNSKIVNSTSEAVKELDRKYSDRISIKNVVDGTDDDKIFLQERTSEDGKYILTANIAEKCSVDSIISIKSKLSPLALDLFTGEVFDIPFERRGERVNIKAKYRPAGSLLIYFPNHIVETKKSPSCLGSGVEFKTQYRVVETIEKHNFSIDESNVLRLDNITLFIDGQKVLDNEIVPKAWYDIFYKTKDGTPFEAHYGFEVARVPEGELYAVVEMAENLDSITLNGQPLQPLRQKEAPLRFDENANWKDISFVKLPFNASILKEGSNRLIIKGKKVNNITGIGTHRPVEDYKEHRPTEVENIFILGDFSVRDVNRKRFFMDGEKTAVDLRDLTATGYPFYGGSVTVQYKFNIKDKEAADFIRINEINAACIEVYINGVHAAVKHWEPYIFDISQFLKEGENTITIKVYSTLFNLLGPNHIEDILERQGVGPYTFVDFKKYTEQSVLIPFGIGSIDIMK